MFGSIRIRHRLLAAALVVTLALALANCGCDDHGYPKTITTGTSGPYVNDYGTPGDDTVEGDAVANGPYLTMDQMSAGCQQQYGQDAVARVAPTTNEPPSYWIKCFGGAANASPLDLNLYCPSGASYNHFRNFPETDAIKPWLTWECE